MTPEQAQLLGEIHANVENLVKAENDHAQRLRSLERSRSWLVGAGAALSAAGGVAIVYLKHLFDKGT